jgi:hypothetical protein
MMGTNASRVCLKAFPGKAGAMSLPDTTASGCSNTSKHSMKGE